MVRAHCCEKMGLKKGPWTREEDQVLINHINLYGHSNWRALPKQAGLLRCGKSCRLRWINYLRPDIKRGNFTAEEVETIINLHQMMGNRWSAIAARLPGRTDNEIKNVWHSHLKKRLKQNQGNPESSNDPKGARPESPQRLTSEVTTSDNTTTTSVNGSDALEENFPEVDENFWSEVFSADDSSVVSGFPAGRQQEVEFQLSPKFHSMDPHFDGYDSSSNDDGIDFWFDLYTTAAGELPDLPEV